MIKKIITFYLHRAFISGYCQKAASQETNYRFRLKNFNLFQISIARIIKFRS